MNNPENHEFHSFRMDKLFLDKTNRWFLNIIMNTIKEDFDYKFKVLFRYDTQPLENYVDDLIAHRETQVAQAKERLLGGRSVEEVEEEYKVKIKEAKENIKQAIVDNPDLFFDVIIWKVEYKNGNETHLTVRILDDEIPMYLNTIKWKLMNFKVTALVQANELDEIVKGK